MSATTDECVTAPIPTSTSTSISISQQLLSASASASAELLTLRLAQQTATPPDTETSPTTSNQLVEIPIEEAYVEDDHRRTRSGGQLPSASDLVLTPPPKADERKKLEPPLMPLDVPPIVILPLLVPVALPQEDPEADVGVIDAITILHQKDLEGEADSLKERWKEKTAEAGKQEQVSNDCTSLLQSVPT